jgi:hypothetical protein
LKGTEKVTCSREVAAYGPSASLRSRRIIRFNSHIGVVKAFDWLAALLDNRDRQSVLQGGLRNSLRNIKSALARKRNRKKRIRDSVLDQPAVS